MMMVQIITCTMRTLTYIITMMKTTNMILLLLLDRYMCPKGVGIIEQWCYISCTEAKRTLDSVPILGICSILDPSGVPVTLLSPT